MVKTAEELDEERYIRDFHFWAKYRNPAYPQNEVSKEEILRLQQKEERPIPVDGAYANPPNNPLVPPFKPPPVAGQTRYCVTIPGENESDPVSFMAENKPNLPGFSQYWKGVRLLGSGLEGFAGLWEYSGPADLQVKHRKIVVKEGRTDRGDHAPRDLAAEAKKMEYLNQSNSEHVVRLIAKKEKLEADDPILKRAGVNELRSLQRVARIYLEFCPLGDLFDLIIHRKVLGKPFQEATLWKFFECLVDSCMVLDSGNENFSEGFDGTKRYDTRMVRDPDLGWGGWGTRAWPQIVHFDIKPDNILLSNADSKHQSTPLVKLGDFGLAQFPEEMEDKRSLRRHGTFFPPEQFTDCWDYKDWKTTDIAGIYGSGTNIWQIGVIMYMMVTLQSTATVVSDSFQPGPISGHPAKGVTFCQDLKHYIPKYSTSLIHTIWDCLYEKPADRITAMELKVRVKEGYEAARKAAIDNNTLLHETWETFLQPDRTARFEHNLALTLKANEERDIAAAAAQQDLNPQAWIPQVIIHASPAPALHGQPQPQATQPARRLNPTRNLRKRTAIVISDDDDDEEFYEKYPRLKKPRSDDAEDKNFRGRGGGGRRVRGRGRGRGWGRGRGGRGRGSESGTERGGHASIQAPAQHLQAPVQAPTRNSVVNNVGGQSQALVQGPAQGQGGRGKGAGPSKRARPRTRGLRTRHRSSTSSSFS